MNIRQPVTAALAWISSTRTDSHGGRRQSFLAISQWPAQRYFLVLFILIGAMLVIRLTTMWFDSQYWGSRAPYLQRPGPHAISVHWQSEESVRGAVRYRAEGASEHDWIWLSEAENSLTHQVRLEGLRPEQNYQYEVWEGEQRVYGPLQFRSWPLASDHVERPISFWVLGDPGLNSQLAQEVRRSSAEWLQQHALETLAQQNIPLDLWFTTGDNAYTSGRNREYQSAIFDPLAQVLAQVPLFPVYGNHDARRWAFYRIFDLPAAGESGGLASGCEAYYSIDYSGVHWVILDSQNRAGAVDSSMYRWLEDDLNASKARWKIAMFHHPPYSHGSHNSDRSRGSDWRLQAMRENYLPVLEKHGVDLVISGHSHAYERSALIHGHYGRGESFDEAQHLLDGGQQESGRWTYHQTLNGVGGTMYVVVGNSAEVHGGEMNHPALPVAMATGGSLMVEVTNNCLFGDMITAAGDVADAFSIAKPGTTCQSQQELQLATH